MNYTSWHVGMKVVCVAPDEPDDLPWCPKEGQVYTVDHIYVCPDDSEVMVEVAEAPNPDTDYRWAGWRAEIFRPVQKRNTDISIFKRLLTDPHVKISEDA